MPLQRVLPWHAGLPGCHRQWQPWSGSAGCRRLRSGEIGSQPLAATAWPGAQPWSAQWTSSPPTRPGAQCSPHGQRTPGAAHMSPASGRFAPRGVSPRPSAGSRCPLMQRSRPVPWALASPCRTAPCTPVPVQWAVPCLPSSSSGCPLLTASRGPMSWCHRPSRLAGAGAACAAAPTGTAGFHQQTEGPVPSRSGGVQYSAAWLSRLMSKVLLPARPSGPGLPSCAEG
mmetsp:Transcript_51776/g.116566  ORF Transcript_51776/g.116566 Transcript_51776/m.116566 type:complete len:228 (-) Transcript_51776:59-742(-)